MAGEMLHGRPLRDYPLTFQAGYLTGTLEAMRKSGKTWTVTCESQEQADRVRDAIAALSQFNAFKDGYLPPDDPTT